MTTRSTHDVT